MKDIIVLVVHLGITVAAFVVGKYVFPNMPKNVTDKLTTLSRWAAKFVEWAKEFLKTKTGQEKMAEVVKKLKEIADEAGIDVTEDQLRAIAQSAYNAMKAGEKEAGTAKPIEAITAQATPTVVINTGVTAVATDKVPDEKEVPL